MTNQEILDLKFKSEDLHKTITIRNYFKELLLTLWKEEEGFSGKRPFGNSGWQKEVYNCFADNNINGNYENLVKKLIKEL
jgi:hypothetical protein